MDTIPKKYRSNSSLPSDIKTFENSFNNNDNSLTNIENITQFILGEKIGEGTFGTVRLGTHILTGERVAVKVLERSKIKEKMDKVRIEREISLLKKLHHANIIKLYSVIETTSTIYLVQEYASGKELFDYIQTKKKLEEEEACKYFQQIISGVEYIHKLGISHRDLKPENMLLSSSNKDIKIVDFGLSNTYRKGELLSTACGSPCYAAPEMLSGKSYNGSLIDIWSCGIILFVMICGFLPFEDENNADLYKKIIKGKFKIPKHVSKDAKDLLKKMLETNPRKRIRIKGIKEHPWFNLVDKKENMHQGIDETKSIMPIDEDLIEKMVVYGYKKEKVRKDILLNMYNNATTTYYLLLKKKLRRGTASVSDFKSNFYEDFINDEANLLSKYKGGINEVIKERASSKGNLGDIDISDKQDDFYDEKPEEKRGGLTDRERHSDCSFNNSSNFCKLDKVIRETQREVEKHMNLTTINNSHSISIKKNPLKFSSAEKKATFIKKAILASIHSKNKKYAIRSAECSVERNSSLNSISSRNSHSSMEKIKRGLKNPNCISSNKKNPITLTKPSKYNQLKVPTISLSDTTKTSTKFSSRISKKISLNSSSSQPQTTEKHPKRATYTTNVNSPDTEERRKKVFLCRSTEKRDGLKEKFTKLVPKKKFQKHHFNKSVGEERKTGLGTSRVSKMASPKVHYVPLTKREGKSIDKKLYDKLIRKHNEKKMQKKKIQTNHSPDNIFSNHILQNILNTHENIQIELTDRKNENETTKETSRKNIHTEEKSNFCPLDLSCVFFKTKDQMKEILTKAFTGLKIKNKFLKKTYQFNCSKNLNEIQFNVEISKCEDVEEGCVLKFKKTNGSVVVYRNLIKCIYSKIC